VRKLRAGQGRLVPMDARAAEEQKNLRSDQTKEKLARLRNSRGAAGRFWSGVIGFGESRLDVLPKKAWRCCASPEAAADDTRRLPGKSEVQRKGYSGKERVKAGGPSERRRSACSPWTSEQKGRRDQVTLRKSGLETKNSRRGTTIRGREKKGERVRRSGASFRLQ